MGGESTLPVSVRLRQNKEKILEAWSIRVKAEAQATRASALPDEISPLPIFFDHVADALSTLPGSRETCTDKDVPIEHGIRRAKAGSYTLELIISEYNLLEEVMLESLSASGPLETHDRNAIAKLFRDAVKAAASAFVATRDELHSAEESQFKRLIVNAKDLAIFIISPEGIIKTWNEGAKRIKQFTADEVLGRHFRMLYCEQDRLEGRPEHNLKLLLENGRYIEQWWRVKKDGTRWWAEVIMEAIYSPDGQIIGVSKMVRDLTEKKKTDDALREAVTASEAASRLKTTFVANMSHEIRTPLGAILGFSEILKDPELDEAERQECVRVIDRNGKVLLRLIEDILDIAKIEAGKLEIEAPEIPVRLLLAEVLALFETKAKTKGLSLTFEIDADTPDYITSDGVRVRQILSNLIGNAIKFTDTGGIHVTAKGYSQTSGTGVELYVIDSGTGIPADKRSRVFGEFSQADASITRKYGGTGLGLALSRHLARKLGGDVELLESGEEKGSTFRVRIGTRDIPGTPKARDYEKVGWMAAQSQNHPYPHLRGSRILVVEDSPDNQLFVRRILTKAGAEVQIARNGEEGVAQAKSGAFDAVLMDMQMPILDGNSATEALRKTGYNRPIIALTAHAMIEDRIKSLNAGCDDYLSKPINTGELLSTLEKWVVQTHH